MFLTLVVRLCRATFGSRKSKAALKKRVTNNWAYWRLVFSDIGNFTHDYVFNHMTPQEVLEANIALDKAIKQIESKSKIGR